MSRQVNRGVRSRDFILPAPIGGLNKRDALGAMAPNFAIEMDNYIPMDNKIALRSGYSLHYKLGEERTGVQTLASYSKPLNNRLIAVYGGKAYNVSSNANVYPYGVAFAESRCQTVEYKNRLFFMNGIDTPKVFYVDDEGIEHFEDWGFTSGNIQPARIIAGAVSHEYLWFVEKNTLKAWHTKEAGTIAGEVAAFDLAQVAKKGGQLIAIANWTVDGGLGLDDYTVFITSEGEILVYSGYNPNDANNWSLKGSYQMSKPIGYQCTMHYQGDIVIISEDGYIPMSKALSAANSGQSAIAFSEIGRAHV